MRSLDIRIIQNLVNQTQSVILPEFSEILDISFDEYGTDLNILYQWNYELSRTNQKMFNIWITSFNNIITPPSDFYKFFRVVEKRFSEVNLASTNMGRVPTMDTTTKYYVFVEEIKTVSENREEKLNDIL